MSDKIILPDGTSASEATIEQKKELLFDRYSKAIQQSYGFFMNQLKEYAKEDGEFVQELTLFTAAQLAAFSKNAFLKDEDRKQFFNFVKQVSDKIVDAENP
ncbi:MAG: hypothetical protein ACO2ZZ_14510 [Cyclobacteriaceae bacterium]